MPPPQIPLGNALRPLSRSNSIGPGVTPGSVPGGRPAITPRPSTPSQRDAAVGGPARREGGATPLASAAQRPRAATLPPPVRRDSAPAALGGSQASALQGQAGKTGGLPSPPRLSSMASPFGRPGPDASMALARPTLGGPKPAGQGSGQASATLAAPGAGEHDSQLSQMLDQLESATRNLREFTQRGADKNDPKKLMEAFDKMMDAFTKLSEKMNERMAAAGQSFAQAAQAPPQG
jgi:hypothetical protein